MSASDTHRGKAVVNSAGANSRFGAGMPAWHLVRQVEEQAVRGVVRVDEGHGAVREEMRGVDASRLPHGPRAVVAAVRSIRQVQVEAAAASLVREVVGVSRVVCGQERGFEACLVQAPVWWFDS